MCFKSVAACLPAVLLMSCSGGGSSPQGGAGPPDASAPDGELDASISDDRFDVSNSDDGPSSTASITPAGGSVSLNGVGTVAFPAGAFAAPQSVTLQQTTSPETESAFDSTAGIFEPNGALGYELRINTGNVGPEVPVDLVLQVPASIVIPDGDKLELFAQYWESGEVDSFDQFELIASKYDSATNTVTASLDPAAFTPYRRADGTFEAIVTLAPTPGTDSASLPPPPPAGGAGGLLPPLEVLTVRSPFDPNRKVLVDGVVYTGHWGTDFVADTGTPVFAVGDGTVLKAYNAGPGSFGLTVLFQVKGIGVVRYAHLDSYGVATNDQVLAGQQIGKTDNTGLTTGPHLHFELAPDGRYWNDKTKVDPAPRISARDLKWHLLVNSKLDVSSTIPEIINESHLKTSAEADLVMKSHGDNEMVLSVVSGTFTVQSYTGMYDNGGGNLCTHQFTEVSYPLTMNDGQSMPKDGETSGGLVMLRELAKPSVQYSYVGAYYTNVNPSYTDVCKDSNKTQALLLSTYQWMHIPGPDKFKLSPDDSSTGGSLDLDFPSSGSVDLKVHYDWTLDKKY